ncbi:hypothetical protein H310_10235 [Aphanomyces invadans]|uniref:Uncharacterized protein n=1 Tax=Aphanomyces invadans TaxID=157072 RepID=A0A024TSB3_9STRA|nr:hypothetical protein H310_10235 [Aphanomyces invadans]ETV96516.1 hypothetical protein H310_10235 [Aphanomyces invadans]|eukprot:XP_008874779.1 hypothetical protein H310_10235 [Aphanomyces invadans]
MEHNIRIQVVCQPPNSPDLNVLDLGFFRALQTLQQRQNCKTIEELVEAVKSAWTDIPMDNLQRNFLTLQSVMVEVIKAAGGNGFSIPHMKKAHLSRRGELPEAVTCPRDVYESGCQKLQEFDSVKARATLADEVLAQHIDTTIEIAEEAILSSNNFSLQFILSTDGLEHEVNDDGDLHHVMYYL